MYVVERVLGRGSTGVVELARAADGTRVAIKRQAWYGSTVDHDEIRSRIQREAEVLGRLDHPAIVPLLDVLEEGDDLLIVMPWYEGGSLHDRVRSHGPLPAGEVAHLGDHLLGALAAAHRAGVVHRDVKPANVLFDAAGRPFLADFGIASARWLTAGLTLGRKVGTPGFLAPEQVRGRTAGPPADVFGLGATLRFALTGAGPYGTSEVPHVLLRRAERNRIDRCPPSVPEPLRRRVDAMLEPRPERRPTAAALAGGPEGTEVAAATPRRRGWPVAAGLGGLAVLLAFPIVAALAFSPDDGSADGSASTSTPTGAASAPTTACTPLRFQPCGRPPAPGTNGARCIDQRADYDGRADNGCEAVPDDLDGIALVEPVEPNIVPAGDVDTFRFDAGDGTSILCNGSLRFTLTAPDGESLRLEVLAADGGALGEVTSAAGVAGAVDVGEPSCGGDDTQTLTLRVTPIGSDRTAAPYRLEVAGSW